MYWKSTQVATCGANTSSNSFIMKLDDVFSEAELETNRAAVSESTSINTNGIPICITTVGILSLRHRCADV